MKKIYSIRNGNIMFWIIMTGSILFALISLILIPHVEALYVLVITLAFLGGAIILIYLKFLNYVTVTSEGIKVKKQFYSWNDVYITAGYRVPVSRHYADICQFYFETEFLPNTEQRKNCKKKGLFMDIDTKRLSLILQYYKKSIYIVNKSVLLKDIVRAMEIHNQNVSLQNKEYN